MNLRSLAADLLCWTVAAPLVRSCRQRKMAQRTQIRRDVMRVEDLLKAIVRAHPDVAW